MKRAADVIIVGGGVMGCGIAYELAKKSVNVLLLDYSLPGRATSASAGGLWPVGEAVGLGCGVIYYAAQTAAKTSANGAGGPEALPAPFRDFLVASNARFPKLAVELLEASALDIEYAPGHGLLFLIYQERQRAFVEHLVQSLADKERPELLTPAEIVRLEPHITPDLIGGALLPGEHQVNPMLLAEAYKRAAIRLGATFRHHTRVTGLRRRGDRVLGVEIGEEFLPAGTVVNAAGAWAGALAATAGLELPVVPVRGQIVLTETLPQTLSVCITTSDCYLAQKLHGEMLIGSTTERAGFDVSVTPEAIRSMCRGAVRAVPLLRRVHVKRTWAGLRPGTPDELPVLGPSQGLEGYLNAAGGFRTGIVASPLTALVTAQLACGEQPSFDVGAFGIDRFNHTGQLEATRN
jgi:hydrogen cyanide synthase HcnC